MGSLRAARAPVHELKVLALTFTYKTEFWYALLFKIFKFRILTCHTQHSGCVLVDFYTSKRFKTVGDRDAHDRGYLRH